MKILLINPSQENVYGSLKKPAFPPLSLAYIGAVLEQKGHDVEVIDMDVDNITKDRFSTILKKGQYRLIGLTTTTPTYNNVVKLCNVIKKESFAKTVIGGIHATVMPRASIALDGIDFLIKGEGEETICELADCLEKNEEPLQVKGLLYKKSGDIIVNEDRELIEDLDVLPSPAWHLFRHLKYTYPDSLYSSVLPLMSSRGCPFNCGFCSAKSIFLKKFRPRSAKNVVDEIEYLIKNYRVREIHFWDDIFTLNRERVFKIKEEILKRKINIKFSFPNGLRVDCVDMEILKALKEMGTYSIAFGVESGNQDILNSVSKGTTIEKIKAAFQMVKKLNIESWGFFMIGFPKDTEATIRNTIDFAIKLNPDIAKFHILKPYPGTAVFDELNQEGLIVDRNFDHYGIHTKPVHCLNNLSEKDLLKWHKIAYRKFYFRPKKIIKLMLRMKTLNRLKSNVQNGIAFIKDIFTE